MLVPTAGGSITCGGGHRLDSRAATKEAVTLAVKVKTPMVTPHLALIYLDFIRNHIPWL